jgi:hypothetical protein
MCAPLAAKALIRTINQMKEKHIELQDTAIRWLHGRNCDTFAKEVPWNGEMVDAIGMKYTDSSKAGSIIYAIEAKTSRSDLICLKQKAAYQRSVQFPALHYYYLIVADGVTVEPSLYPMWGVIDERGKVIRKAKRLTTAREHYRDLARDIAHVLVYKTYGKLYLSNPTT